MEDLKKEHAELKSKLINLVDYMNSAEYYQLSDNRKKILYNKKICLEMYLKVLNMQVYEDIDSIFVPDLGAISMLGSMFSNTFTTSLFPPADSKCSNIDKSKSLIDNKNEQ